MRASTLPDKPLKLIDEPDFRLVRVFIGDGVEHVLEVRDGVDAMGVERWRRFETRGIKNLEAIHNYLVRVVLLLKAKEYEPQ